MSAAETQTSPVRSAPLVGVFAWLAAVAAGMLLLIAYSYVPGEERTAPEVWPADSTLRRPAGLPTLLVFLHPRCACSRASLSELARALSSSNRPVHVQAVIYCPEDQPKSWAQSDVWKKAEKASAAAPAVDRQGREAARFGATTSGHVMFFSPDGTLQYSGGVTSGRAHEGDNVGRQAIEALLEGKPVSCASRPVYGCPILTSESPVN